MNNWKPTFFFLGLAVFFFGVMINVQGGIGLGSNTIVYVLPFQGTNSPTPVATATPLPTSTPLPTLIPTQSVQIYVIPRSAPNALLLPPGTPVGILGRHIVQHGEW